MQHVQQIQALNTIPEFSAIARIGKTKAWSLVNQRAIPSVQIGRKVFVTDQAIEAFLTRCERPEYVPPSSGRKLSAIEKLARRKNAPSDSN